MKQRASVAVPGFEPSRRRRESDERPGDPSRHEHTSPERDEHSDARSDQHGSSQGITYLLLRDIEPG